MTERQRGRLLPPLAVCFALGILLGRVAASPWYGVAACLLGLPACLLLRGRARFCALLVFFVALGCLRGFFAYHPALPAPGQVKISGIVSEEIQSRSNGQFRTTLSRVALDGVPLSGAAYWSFYADEMPEGLAPGMAVSFDGRVYHPSGPSNPDGYDFREELLRRGIRVGLYGKTDLEISPPAVFSFAGFTASLRHRLSGALAVSLGEETGAYASAMLLGTKSFLPREDRTAFSRLGIAHILSVSGFHVGILIALLGLLFRFAGLPQRLRFWLYAVCLLFYCALCGWNQPVLRASLLLLLAHRGRMMNRPRILLHLLSAAFLFLLVLSPVQLTGLSFQLSFAAVLGLAVLTPFFSSLFRTENRLLHRLWEAFSAALGAQIGILLPELYAFQTLPLLGLVLNVPVLGFGAGMIGLYWLVLLFLPVPGLSGLICAVARGATSALLAVVRFLGVIPGIALWTKASGPVTALGVLLLGLGCCALFRFRKRIRLSFAAAGLLLIILSLIPLPHFSTEYVQLSVGSADAAVLRDQNTVIAVDAGYEDGVLSDYLHRRRLTPDAVILTHLHSDHCFGLQALVEDGIPVRVIYLPDGALDADIHSNALLLLEQLQAGGTEIRFLSAGDTIPLPSGEIRVLWPEAGKTRPGQDANESCLVLRLNLRETSLLQTGDLDGRYEMYAAAPADLLKVAHHGSVHSSSAAFLSRVNPQAALLTCDDLDRHAQVAERFGDLPLFSTAAGGMLTVHFQDHAFSIETFLPVPEVISPDSSGI